MANVSKNEKLRLQDTVRMAAARSEITLALARTGDLQPILQEVSELLARHLHAAFVRVWILNAKKSMLELKASAGMYRHLDGEHSRIPLGRFKIGRIAQSRESYLTNQVQDDKEISNPEWARREGMQSFAGFPLLVAGKVVGVIALFSRQQMPEILIKELSFAADNVAQFVQRQTADQAQREAEEALKAYAEKLEQIVTERTAHLQETIGDLEAFSYSVSHDLRTPLRAIEGYAEALLEDCAHKLDREHVDYLERIKRGALRLDRLTLDLLAYSRLSRLDFRPEPVDLDRLVHEIIDQYPHLHAAQSNIEVESPLLPVMGHPSFLTQCVSNLLSNALKFIAEGTEPLVKVWTEKIDEKIRLHVRDNGIGIAPKHHEKVFEIFGRIQNERFYEGTGIGLAVVKRAVDRMGGKIGFKSQPGKGTCFWVELLSVVPV
ncbi:MAG: GAF domain-containing sensor histidine kinase [Verrucomicrobiota bacterium]